VLCVAPVKRTVADRTPQGWSLSQVEELGVMMASGDGLGAATELGGQVAWKAALPDGGSPCCVSVWRFQDEQD
jgi:hypothetical protein